MRASVLVLISASLLIAACGSDTTPRAEAPATAPAAASPASPAAPAASRPRIVFLGDSLTAGLGLEQTQSFPALIGKRLTSEGLNYEIVNAGVSGDTSAGGLRRLEWSLEGDVKVLVLALGANDGLRGLPAAELKKNLASVIEQAKARGVTVLLAGMEAPPNFGDDYTREFRAVYADLAKEYDVRLIPFLLAGVAGNATLNQGDGIHPNVKGAAIVADLVWPELKRSLPRPNE